LRMYVVIRGARNKWAADFRLPQHKKRSFDSCLSASSLQKNKRTNCVCVSPDYFSPPTLSKSFLSHTHTNVWIWMSFSSTAVCVCVFMIFPVF
jgi:hypothetical protein